jgi:ATP-dependent Lon protease
VARRVAEGGKGRVTLTADNVHEFLGPARFLPEEMLARDQVGVATGLAWTPVGGDILFIEVIPMKGSGGLTLTGQLGDVMKESARAALSYTKAKAAELGLAKFNFAKHDVHIHIPEGAIPKDGPSAGVTIAIALISAFTARPVKKEIAMTGEITLRGTILPVGGIKEKVLAAKRMGIKTVIMPRQNEKDLSEIQQELREGMKFHFVSHIDEVIKLALQGVRSKPSGTRRTRKTAGRRKAR